MKSLKSICGVLTMLLGIVSVSYAASPAARTNAVADPDQPFMQAALRDLEKAQRQLQDAKSDKGGYRVKALEYVGKAIGDVNKGIEYDRTHAHGALSSGVERPGAAAISASADQPHMQAALKHLEDAQANLQKATSDKGGYRVKALENISRAIEAVNKGIAYAR